MRSEVMFEGKVTIEVGWGLMELDEKVMDEAGGPGVTAARFEFHRAETYDFTGYIAQTESSRVCLSCMAILVRLGR